MKRKVRVFAVLLLTVMLPAQGLAAACAQICATVAQERHVVAMQAMHAVAHEAAPHGEAMPHEDCGKSELGAGKCCQAHVFVLQSPVAPTIAMAVSFERIHYVARWASFIPEEPSPPPIASRATA